MNRTLIVLVFCILALSSFAKPVADKEIFRRLKNLQGAWMMKSKKGMVLFECWEVKNDSTVQCKTYRLKGIDMQEEESVKLVLGSSGISYIPAVNNQNDGKAVTFKLTSSTTKRFVFENAAHDFPRRVVYLFTTPGKLEAYIDGGPKDAGNRIKYTYQKIN